MMIENIDLRLGCVRVNPLVLRSVGYTLKNHRPPSHLYPPESEYTIRVDVGARSKRARRDAASLVSGLAACLERGALLFVELQCGWCLRGTFKVIGRDEDEFELLNVGRPQIGASMTPTPEVTFTEAELKTITRFVRQAFADRLTDDQRRMLVEDFAADEPTDQRETGKVADFRSQVFALRYAVEEALKSQLKDALTKFCGRSW